MRIIGVDFETYYTDEYSLSKLTTEQYVRDPRFEIIGVSVKCDIASAAEWFSGTEDEVLAFLDARINWEHDAVLAHNAAFDGAICSWRLNRKPKLWLCSMSMARPRHLKTIGVSLAALATHYGIGHKGREVHAAKGKRRGDFAPADLCEYGKYSTNDIDLTYSIFYILVKDYTAVELQAIDHTIRMFTEPKFRLNTEILQQHLDEVIAHKEALLASVGADSRDSFMSNDKFAELLQAEGVDPPMKWSNKQQKMVWAFAKQDKGLKDLLSHENHKVQALVACRLGVKSTIEETRAQAFLGIAERGLLPVMLNYWGAGTGRYSGGDKINLQNLRRGGKLRYSLEGPAGYHVVASDLSQIEARVLALVAGQDDLVEAFRGPDRDPYCEFGTDEVYFRPITKANFEERWVSKTCILGLGFYTGAKKLKETLRIGVGQLSVIMPLEECEQIVKRYRKRNSKIVDFWGTCGKALVQMTHGGKGWISAEFNISYDGENVILPNGAVLRYPKLERYFNEDEGKWELRYLNRGKWTHIYSGLLCENIIQALARGVIIEYLVQIGDRYGVALQVHDEVVSVVPISRVDEAKEFIKKTMSTPVQWLPGLPVECEVHSGPSYGDCK